jgi:oligopeptidase A
MNMQNINLPNFHKIDLSKVAAQLDEILSENLQAIDVLVANKNPSWNNLLLPLEEIDSRLDQFWGMVSHLNSVCNSNEIRDVYSACIPKLTIYQSKIGHNHSLFERLLAIKESAEFAKLHYAQKKAIENNIRDFKLSGIDLSAQAKERYTNICQRLAELANTFEQNVLDATAAFKYHVTSEEECSGIPESTLAVAANLAATEGVAGYLFTIDIPTYIAVIQYADKAALRKIMYTAYTTRASDRGPNAGEFNNQKIMEEILLLRQELAVLLDFNSYAEYSLATKMVASAEDVLKFIDDLVVASKTRAQQELDDLALFAKTQLGIDKLHAWDIAYASEKLRMHEYDINDEQLRPYFPSDKVIVGMFKVAQNLFEITIEPMEGVDTWHNDVLVYKISNAKQEPMAILYMDLYARKSKRGGAWMTDFRTRRRMVSGEVVLPIAFISCNFAPGVAAEPALLRHDDVVTLFHEFGHALQHMLTKIEYLDVAGLNGIAWDAVEIASQLMENWAWQQEGIELISAHYRTGVPLPKDILQRLRKAKNFQAAMQMLRQLEFSLFDMRIHMGTDFSLDNGIQQELDKVRAAISVVPVPEFNRFQHSFSHIFAGGYSAGYYSYKWAEVMSQDIFNLFLEKGIFDKKTSNAFKETFLAEGGAIEPMDLFIKFRGRKPSVAALLIDMGIKV